MSKWPEELKDDIISQCMDVCANVDKLRQVIILTMDKDGTMNISQHSKDGMVVERIGMYRLMLSSEERNILDCWHESDHPNSED